MENRVNILVHTFNDADDRETGPKVDVIRRYTEKYEQRRQT